MKPLLSVTALSASFEWRPPAHPVIEDIHLELTAGACRALVGETGSGKTTLMLAALQLLTHAGGTVHQGMVQFDGIDLTRAAPRVVREHWGKTIGYCSQDAEVAFDPLRTLLDFAEEPLRRHTDLKRSQRERRIRDALLELGASDIVDRLEGPASLLSTGMRQVLALAISGICQPQLWVLDDPTSSLDALNRQPLVDTIRQRVREHGVGVWFSTHDLGLVLELAQRVDVMYAGQIVESADVSAFFEDSAHPYSIGLLTSAAAVRPSSPHLARLPVIAADTPAEQSDGCRFRSRCAYYQHVSAEHGERCRTEIPELREVRPLHFSRCHYAENVLA